MFLMFSVCLLYSCIFLYGIIVAFYFIFLLNYVRKMLIGQRDHELSRPKCNSRQDVMLGLNPSRPAVERCLDCPLYTVCLFLFVLSMSGMLSLE